MAYKEWLEHIISEYQPDWICDKLTEIGDYCEKNCRSDWNSNCLRRYYEAVVQKARNDMKIPMEDWLRGCVYHYARNGQIMLPTDKIIEIADYIQDIKASVAAGMIELMPEDEKKEQ